MDFCGEFDELEVRSACLTNIFQSTASNPLEILLQAIIPKSSTDSPVLLSYFHDSPSALIFKI